MSVWHQEDARRPGDASQTVGSRHPCESQPGGNAFLREVLEAVRAVDLLCILAVPAVLVGVYALPTSVRRAALFSYTDPTLATAFAAPYVHLDAGHLLANLGGYALVVPAAYLLSVLSGRRGRFVMAFATFVLAFPVALSYLNLAFVRPAVGFGFSGVVMAFFGFLPLALAGFVHDRFDVGDEMDLAGALFFAGMAPVSLLVAESVVTDGLAAAALLAAVLFAWSSLEGTRRFGASVRAATAAPGYFELSAVGLVAFLAFPFLAFPTDPGAGGTIVNVYVHMLGYAMGFIATYATLQLSRSVEAAVDRDWTLPT